MIALDTNVLLRYLMADDPGQGATAAAFMETLSAARPGYISLPVVMEVAWVLGHRDRYDRETIAAALLELLLADALVIEAADAVHAALRGYVLGGPGFADHLILACAQAKGCEGLATFDRRLAGQAGAELLG